MSKIRIVNWLLTRKCNLNCSYCAITKNYENKPKEYPDISHYYKNEMPLDYILNGLKKFNTGNNLLEINSPPFCKYANGTSVNFIVFNT